MRANSSISVDLVHADGAVGPADLVGVDHTCGARGCGVCEGEGCGVYVGGWSKMSYVYNLIFHKDANTEGKPLSSQSKCAEINLQLKLEGGGTVC